MVKVVIYLTLTASVLWNVMHQQLKIWLLVMWYHVRCKLKSTKVVAVAQVKDHVLLKLDHLGAEAIDQRLPGIREISIQFWELIQ